MGICFFFFFVARQQLLFDGTNLLSREVLGLAFAVATKTAPIEETKFGVFRM